MTSQRFKSIPPLAFLAACISLTPLNAQSRLPATGFDVGQPFPVRPFPSLEGDPVSLAEFRGKKLLLHVFASW